MATSTMSGGLVTGVSASSQGRHSKISHVIPFWTCFQLGGGAYENVFVVILRRDRCMPIWLWAPLNTTAALRRLVQSAAIRPCCIPTTDKEHETLATNLGRLQIKQESHALLQSNVHVLKLILTQDIL